MLKDSLLSEVTPINSSESDNPPQPTSNILEKFTG